MDWLSGLVDFFVNTIDILAALFFAYGAYLAIYRKELWGRPPKPEPEKDAPRPDELRLHIRRPGDGRAIRVDNKSGEPAPVQRVP
jgi:hypothetical protein